MEPQCGRCGTSRPPPLQPRDEGVEVDALAPRERALGQAARVEGGQQLGPMLRRSNLAPTRVALAFIIQNFRRDGFHFVTIWNPSLLAQGVAGRSHTVFHAKEALFAELQADVRLIEPVVAFARRVAATHPVGIASGGGRDIVQRMLELTKLALLFRVVVTAGDVMHGKPAPDMFLLAAKRMGVAPERCLVFEDAEPGMRAAEAAGMQWVRVASRKT